MAKERKIVMEHLTDDRLGDDPTDDVLLLPETQTALDGWSVVSHSMLRFVGLGEVASGYTISMLCEREAAQSGPPVMPRGGTGAPDDVDRMQW